MTSRSSYVQLVRDNRPFRRLWLADLTSLFGDWFNTIALYTAVDQLLGTSQAVGWVVVAKTLPVLLISPIAGPLVDSLPRRRLMIASDLVRALLGLVLVLAWTAESVVGLYACTVLQVLASGVFLPAKNAAIPSLVGRADIGVANAVSGATWSVALAFGAAAGGFVTELFGIGAAFALDAVTYVGSAWLLRALPALVPEGAHGSEGTGFVAGLRYLLRTPRLVPMVLLKSGMAWTSAAVPLLTIYGNRVLSNVPAPWIVGVLLAARGAGAAAGSLSGRRVLGESTAQLQRAAIAGFVVLAGAYGALSVAGSVWTCALAVLVAGFGSALIWVASSVLLQREVAPAYLGRTFSLDFGLMTVTGALFIPAVTALVDGDALSVRGGMALCGALALPPGLVLAVWMARASRPEPALTDRA